MIPEPYTLAWLLHQTRVLLLGAFVGFVAVAFRLVLALVSDLRHWLLDPGHVPHAFPALRPWLGLALALLAGLLFSLAAILAGVRVVLRLCPEAAGSGIPGVKALARNPHPTRWFRLLLVKFSGGVLSIGGGLTLGREGPTIQMGAALGEAAGLTGRLTPGERRQLLLVGAGAGLAGAFNAPLAGALLVFEEFREEFRADTCLAALLATFSATWVCRLLTGQAPDLGVIPLATPPLPFLPCFLLVGWLAGLLGVAYNQSLLALLRFRRRLNPWALPAILAVSICVTGWLLPHAAEGGYALVDRALTGAFGLPEALVLLGLRVALTVGSYATGAAGGLFAPLLVFGAILGHLVSRFCVAVDREALVVVAMAATFSGIVRAPLTGVLLLVEMAGAQALLLPLLGASLLAKLTADALGDKPIYDALEEQQRAEGATPETTESPR